MNLGQEERELIASRTLIELSVKGFSGSEIGRAVEELRPLIERQVKGQCRICGSMPDATISDEDIIQDVLIKMIENPPNRECEPGKERVAVMAWVKTTSRNILVDKTRRAKVRGIRTNYNESSAADHQPDQSVQGGEEVVHKLEAKQKIEKLRNYLRRYYPRGIEYLQTRQKNPDASGYELAESMGVTRANLDQIARRTRLWAVRFQELSASEGEKE
jgi:DNA-directed RNA polymerase specialized sigma24 family protein